jgi:hypothetical protein
LLKDWVTIGDLDLDVHLVKEGVAVESRVRPSRRASRLVPTGLAPSHDGSSDDDAQRRRRGNYLLEDKAGPFKQVAKLGSGTFSSRGGTEFATG